MIIESWMKRIVCNFDGSPVFSFENMELFQDICLFFLGLVELAHDGHFVFAEVNADIMNWVIHKDGDKTVIYTDQQQ